MGDQNALKRKLTDEFADVLKHAASEYPSGAALSAESTQTLCNVIEAVFIHGLKKAFFLKKPRGSKYPEPNFWPFVSKYTHKAVLDQLASSKQIRTEIGKSRAWVRILLNENTMENYLNLFSRSVAALSKFYEKWAFLRDSEQMNVLSGYAKGLSRLTVEAPINSSLLNSWTPTPLILSGLMPGKPATLEQLVSTRRHGGSLDKLDDTEVAKNALEYLCDLAEVSTSSGAEGSEIDDEGSVYSHPSMLDDGTIRFPVLAEINSTVLSNPVPEDSAISCDSHQIRVTRRTHRCIRRSSKSSSCDSSKNSQKGSRHSLVDETQNVDDVKKSKNSESDLEYVPLNSNRTEIVSCGSENFPTTCEAKKEVSEEENSLQSVRELSVEKDLCAENDFVSPTTSDETAAKNRPNEFPFETGYTLYSLCPEVTFENDENPVFVSGKDEEKEMKTRDTGKEHSLSLHDELCMEDRLRSGNSLLGKGWVHCYQKPGFSVAPNSTVSSSASTDSSRNFDLEIRNVLDRTSNEMVLQNRSTGDISNDKVIAHGEAEQLNQHDRGILSSPDFILSSSQEVASKSEIRSDGLDSELSNDALIQVLTTIPREKGLDAQDFRCPSCRKSIGPTFASYRKCGFDGKYYCSGCWNKSEESVIPSRLVRNWDGHPRPVCRSNMAFIESIRDKPIFRIDRINPQLYRHSNALNNVKFLREKLALSAMYLLSCRKSVAEDLERRIWPKDYLYNDIHLYSLTDLLTVLSGYMEKHLNNLFSFTTEHIRRCVLCAQKGFICEICSSSQVIYPFQLEITTRCLDCFSIYHKNCIEQQQCPKCIRRERYSQQQPDIASDHLFLDVD